MAEWSNRDELERAARSAAGGYRQAQWVEEMLDGGCKGQFTGSWAASQYRSVQALRLRLARWGVRTEHVAVGPRGGRRWLISPVMLSPLEMRAWDVFGTAAEAMLARACKAGLSEIDRHRLLDTCELDKDAAQTLWANACRATDMADSPRSR